MMAEISLSYNHGFPWFVEKGVFVKGYAFDDNNKLYQGGALAGYFGEAKDIEEFRSKLERANGVFSVIVQHGETVYAAVDRTRTFPLFYRKTDRGLHISDNTSYFRKTLNLNAIDPRSAQEFLCTGYVTGRETLLKGVFQIQAGEYLVYDGKPETEFYHIYTAASVSGKSEDELEQEFLNILDASFERLISSVRKRTIVVPLSGGYDSRLVAVMLKRLGYENVVCFTYGRHDSPEIGISKQVAEKLGYRFHYVAYNDNLYEGYAADSRYRVYADFAANHTSVFLLQDYFAVRHLHDNSLIQRDSVFVPGHTGDFISGGHIPGILFDAANPDVTGEILNRHYSLQSHGRTAKFRGKIDCLMNDGSPYSRFEDWELRERQAKFIVNADRTYEIFGYEHRIPLWDNEIVAFFKCLDPEFKRNKRFYDRVLEERLFSEYGFDIRELRKGSMFVGGLKRRLRRLLPAFLFHSYKRKRDYYCVYPMARELLGSMKNRNGIDVWCDNQVIARWYLERVKGD